MDGARSYETYAYKLDKNGGFKKNEEIMKDPNLRGLHGHTLQEDKNYIHLYKDTSNIKEYLKQNYK